MLIRLVQAGLLLAITVAFHGVVLSGIFNRVQRCEARIPLSFPLYSWLLIRIALLTILAHLLEIGLWAAFYVWKDALPGWEAAAYFSAATYATIGYGDIVLPEAWRLLSAVEGLTGILMCGWSAAFFFAVVGRLYPRSPQ